ncbi:MAG: GNAT family N-acetyltransferase [Chloroflexi bacterium]|nr:GNAT family N-acetyltransferase [Chloroflexota bacterium]
MPDERPRRYPPDLHTERLTLRPFTLVDAARVQRLAGDEAIARYTLNIPHPYEDGMAEAWIESHPDRFQAGESATFAITLREERLLIGAIGLTFAERHHRAEMGYWIAADRWGQGYGTEAARAVLRYAFAERGLHKVMATHLAPNVASGRVMLKIGMSQEGVQREHVLKNDRYEDLVLYGILREEWERQQGES